jgi:hypothetical protein
MYPGAPAPAARPATVTASAYLLYAAAALSLIGSLTTLSTIGKTSDVYKDAYEGTAAQGTESFVLAASVVGVVINILFVAGLAILAIFNSRGRQGSRVTTWALGGVVLCCSGLGLAGSAATNALGTSSSTGGPSPREIQDRLDEVLPSWYRPVTITLSVLMVLALLAALILLALPASNTYFRAIKAMRQGGGWDPSMPYPVYPGQQPYPGQPYPGQPYPGQPYPGQPYPGQPYPGQPYPGQGYPGEGAGGQQPYPGLPAYPGQQPSGSPAGYGQPPSGYGQPPSGSPAPGSPASGWSGSAATTGAEPSSGGQFGGPSTSPPSGEPSPDGPAPHTGSMPPIDPWDRQPDDEDHPKPPTDPNPNS